MKLLVEGKSKKIYEQKEENLMIFKPHLRSITYKREGEIVNTDKYRAKTSLYIMQELEKKYIPTQLAKNELYEKNGEYGMYVKKNITPIPIEFIIRYFASGSIVRNFPSLVTEGMKFKQPLIKLDYKFDNGIIDDPMLNDSYIIGLGLLTKTQLNIGKEYLMEVGYILREILLKSSIDLVDFKMEFGIDKQGNILVIDEISQDCIRANNKSNDSITKDTYRQHKSNAEVLEAYKTFDELIRK